MTASILLWCVALPALIGVLTLVLLGIFRKYGETAQYAALIAGGICVTGWSLAIGIALYWRQSPGWWPEESWQAVGWPIVVTAFAFAILLRTNRHGNGSVDSNSKSILWVTVAIGGLWVGMTAMPSGEAWNDLLSLHRVWLPAVAGCGLLNLWAMNATAERSGERWILWVAVAGLAAAAFLAGATFGGLMEWVLAAIAVTMVFAIGASIAGPSEIYRVLAGASFFAAAATAASRFYTYEDHPRWLYAVILLLPSLATIPDRWISMRRTKSRIAVAAFLSAFLLGAIAWQLLLEP